MSACTLLPDTPVRSQEQGLGQNINKMHTQEAETRARMTEIFPPRLPPFPAHEDGRYFKFRPHRCVFVSPAAAGALTLLATCKQCS